MQGAPLEEVEIYRDIVRQMRAQLAILTKSDPSFIFLETIMVSHLVQLDDAITVRNKNNGQTTLVFDAEPDCLPVPGAGLAGVRDAFGTDRAIAAKQDSYLDHPLSRRYD